VQQKDRDFSRLWTDLPVAAASSKDPCARRVPERAGSPGVARWEQNVCRSKCTSAPSRQFRLLLTGKSWRRPYNHGMGPAPDDCSLMSPGFLSSTDQFETTANS